MAMKADINELIRRVQQKPDGKSLVKVRSLLSAFGASRRSPELVQTIQQQLATHGIVVDLSVSSPPSLDDRVALVRMVTRIVSPAPTDTPAPPLPPTPPVTAAIDLTTTTAPATREVAIPATETLPEKERPRSLEAVAQADTVGTARAEEPRRSLAVRLLRTAQSFFAKDAPTVLRLLANGTKLTQPTRSHESSARPEKRSSNAEVPSVPVHDPDLSHVAEQTLRATVFIEREDGGYGSGFIVHEDGLVITACHVLDSPAGLATKAKVRLYDGREGTASLIRAHRSLDFALLWLDQPGTYPSLKIGKAEKLRYAETVLAVGHPGTDGTTFMNTVSTGVVANPISYHYGVEWIQTQMDTYKGNSGGPLVNRRGEVVGIICWGSNEFAAAEMALPLDYVAGDVAETMAKGRDGYKSGYACSICGTFVFNPQHWFCPICGATNHVTASV
jgi:S1-C subfamily serine protease